MEVIHTGAHFQFPVIWHYVILLPLHVFNSHVVSAVEIKSIFNTCRLKLKHMCVHTHYQTFGLYYTLVKRKEGNTEMHGPFRLAQHPTPKPRDL